VGNAATLAVAPLTAGEIVSLFGNGLGPATAVSGQPANQRYPTTLGGTQVTFDGVTAPLLYVSDGQINAIVPWGITGNTTNACVRTSAGGANCVSMDVDSAAPGLFQLSSGYAAAVNQDGTINSPENPAAAGSIISFYGTGLGLLSPAPADGSIVAVPGPALLDKVNVWFFPSPANTATAGETVYAGPAPLEVAGLFQINVRIPLSPVTAVSTAEIVVEIPNGATFVNPYLRVGVAIKAP